MPALTREQKLDAIHNLNPQFYPREGIADMSDADVDACYEAWIVKAKTPRADSARVFREDTKDLSIADLVGMSDAQMDAALRADDAVAPSMAAGYPSSSGATSSTTPAPGVNAEQMKADLVAAGFPRALVDGWPFVVLQGQWTAWRRVPASTSGASPNASTKDGLTAEERRARDYEQGRRDHFASVGRLDEGEDPIGAVQAFNDRIMHDAYTRPNAQTIHRADAFGFRVVTPQGGG